MEDGTIDPIMWLRPTETSEAAWWTCHRRVSAKSALRRRLLQVRVVIDFVRLNSGPKRIPQPAL